MKSVQLIIFDVRDVTIDRLSKLNFLVEKDLNEVNKYKSLEIKKEKLASLYLKNKYIGDYSYNEYGKPLSDKMHFNITHSHGVVVLALCEYDIGVDIERIEERKDNLAKYISTQEELDYIKGFREFFEVWTSKESLMKCIGVGIRCKVKEIPALPINGSKEYRGEKYYSKSLERDNFILSITVKNDTDFEIEISEETVE